MPGEGPTAATARTFQAPIGQDRNADRDRVQLRLMLREGKRGLSGGQQFKVGKI
jgi:hypothetical protein